ncbi:MAG: glycoside hydrolase family 127 protein [Clostridia bacterium]|nr:glycoside hydrolase family 127 protein [Clostridia bacterium]
MEDRFQFLEPGAYAFSGVCREYLDFTLNRQLLSPETWANFVRVFTEDSDDADRGWRCEYWGKMMRGACLCYRAAGSERLYCLLRDTVKNLLQAQRPDGRISTYSPACQMTGWDLWGRKYVMTGLIHFLEICREAELRRAVTSALISHADAVMDQVGPGKRAITETSDYWGGVNSCSILEPFVALYGLTRDKRYLRFAEYILSTGGCRDGNLVKLALENKVPPYQYPEVKAYETMSFFEGVLAYYQATGKEDCLLAAVNFADAVAETDLTIIGCCGCTHELFDHSAVRQAEPSSNIMQETCVSVTWMRLCLKLLLATGDSRYYGFIERTGYNALYGAVNIYGLKQYDRQSREYLPALPFDSYSPLADSRRGVGIGGLKRFSFGGFYGCCACIASAGIALLPLSAVMQARDGVLINGLFSGKAVVRTAEGRKIRLSAESAYPAEGRMRLSVEPEGGPAACSLYLRAPDEMRNLEITVNGRKAEQSAAEGGYIRLFREFAAGDVVEIRGVIPLIRETAGDSAAFRYGAVVLARDENKEPDYSCQAPQTDESLSYEMLPPQKGEMVRLLLRQKPGMPPLLLTDYASCGKRWNLQKCRVTVWMRNRDQAL